MYFIELLSVPHTSFAALSETSVLGLFRQDLLQKRCTLNQLQTICNVRHISRMVVVGDKLNFHKAIDVLHRGF